MRTETRHRSTPRTGLAVLASAAALLLFAAALPAEADHRDRRDRRDVHRGHAERGHHDDRWRHDRRGERGHEARRWDRHPHERRDWRWERRQRRLHDRYHDFEIPRRIRHDHVRHYHDYHRGRLYFRPHGHHHDVYYFPVLTRWGWELTPHYYCGGSLYDGGGYVEYRGRNLGFGVRF